MRLFFYGTLLDPDVLAAVVGPSAAKITLTSARLDGWRRRRARGRSYPIILPVPGDSVTGVVTSALLPEAVARLSAYEGPGYGLHACRPVLADGSAVEAQVYLPNERLAADAAEWDLGAWQANEKATWLDRLRRGTLNV